MSGNRVAHRVGVGSDQRVAPGQVEVVGDDHERPGAVRRVDAAGGVGQDHDPRARGGPSAARARTTNPAEWPSYRWNRPCWTTTGTPARRPKSSRPAWPGAVARRPAGHLGEADRARRPPPRRRGRRGPSPAPGRRAARARSGGGPRPRARRGGPGCSAGGISRPSTNSSLPSARSPARLLEVVRPERRAAAARQRSWRERRRRRSTRRRRPCRGPNSTSSWRQMPHGVDGSAVGVTTTTAADRLRARRSPPRRPRSARRRSWHRTRPIPRCSRRRRGRRSASTAAPTRKLGIWRARVGLGRSAASSSAGNSARPERRRVPVQTLDTGCHDASSNGRGSRRAAAPPRSGSVLQRRFIEPGPGGDRVETDGPEKPAGPAARRADTPTNEAGAQYHLHLRAGDIPSTDPDARRPGPRDAHGRDLGGRPRAGLPPRVPLGARHVQGRPDRGHLERRRGAEPRDRDAGVRRDRRRDGHPGRDVRRASGRDRAGRPDRAGGRGPARRLVRPVPLARAPRLRRPGGLHGPGRGLRAARLPLPHRDRLQRRLVLRRARNVRFTAASGSRPPTA